MAIAREGDRLILIEMPNDPAPLPAGARGTVTYVNEGIYGAAQITVKWDPPNETRTLMLVEGADRYEIISQCYAGSLAFFGGKWLGMAPCKADSEHVVATDNVHIPPVHLCETHFQEVLAAGMVTDPYVGGRDEWEAKYGKRPEPRGGE